MDLVAGQLEVYLVAGQLEVYLVAGQLELFIRLVRLAPTERQSVQPTDLVWIILELALEGLPSHH